MDIDIIYEAGDWPDAGVLNGLVETAVKTACNQLGGDGPGDDAGLCVVFSDDHAVEALNKTWRGKDKPTNVLSFPAGNHAGGALGDIILASETVLREAELESKPLPHHISHLVVHGFLHLLGYDHEIDEEAAVMESTETQILAALDIPDPYAL